MGLMVSFMLLPLYTERGEEVPDTNWYEAGGTQSLSGRSSEEENSPCSKWEYIEVSKSDSARIDNSPSTHF
jgi:hypothetical protein